MTSWRAQLLIAGVCLVLGLLLVPQFRSQRASTDVLSQPLTEQAAYITSLYQNNLDLQDQLLQLKNEVNQYQRSDAEGTSSLGSLVKDIQTLRIANGEVDVVGPGVRVTIDGAIDVRHLQDAVNELRSAGVDSMTINDIRLVTRSIIAADDQGNLLVDKQPISRPYVVSAIGNPDTLDAAANRKGGLFELWQATEKLNIRVEKITDQNAWLKMPKTAIDNTWRYAQPVQ